MSNLHVLKEKILFQFVQLYLKLFQHSFVVELEVTKLTIAIKTQ